MPREGGMTLSRFRNVEKEVPLTGLGVNHKISYL